MTPHPKLMNSQCLQVGIKEHREVDPGACKRLSDQSLFLHNWFAQEGMEQNKILQSPKAVYQDTMVNGTEAHQCIIGSEEIHIFHLGPNKGN